MTEQPAPKKQNRRRRTKQDIKNERRRNKVNKQLIALINERWNSLLSVRFEALDAIPDDEWTKAVEADEGNEEL